MLYIVGLAPTLRIDTELQQPTNLETTIIALVKRFYLTNTKIETSTPSTTEHSHIEISLHEVIGITTS
jgi:hypothetical protein